MMTREQLHKMVVEIFVLLFLSVGIIFVINIFAENRYEKREQLDYSVRFSDVLEADSYSEIKSDLYSLHRNVNCVYQGFDSEGDPVGYISDVSVTQKDGRTMHLLLGINSDGMVVTGLRSIVTEETDISLDDEEMSALMEHVVGAQVPVALSSILASEDIVYSSVAPLRGLNDGVFYAQETEAGRDGYIDFVEIEVSNGIIIRVNWDAFNTDLTTEYRSNASLTGAFNMPGEPWANQSYNLCHALINLQDPARLAMKSDKTTEIVPGVTCDISDFVRLSQECIMNSRANFDKTDYNNGLISILEDIGIVYETAGITDENGHIVYSFGDTSVFADGRDTVLQVTDSVLFSRVENEYSSDASGEQYDDSLIEGGYEIDEEAPFRGGVDGLPYSEIRTYLDGLDENNDDYNYVISCINSSYKFLKDYLNWVA